MASDSTPSDSKVTELFVKGHEPSQVSERYEELDAVSGLSGSYNEDNNSIEVSWDYDTDSEEDVNFDISASIDGGSMQSLSSTSDTSMEISDVEEGAEYTIQVIAERGSLSSDPATTTVQVPGGEEDEEEEDEEIPGVSGLSAEYDGDETINVSWGYDGPSANFEVSVNGDTENVGSNSINVSGVTPGDYNISVTPISDENSDLRGPSSSTSVTVHEAEEEEDEEETEEEEPPEDENEEESESDSGSESDSDSGSDSESDSSEDTNTDDNDSNNGNDEENNDSSGNGDSNGDSDNREAPQEESNSDEEDTNDPAPQNESDSNNGNDEENTEE